MMTKDQIDDLFKQWGILTDADIERIVTMKDHVPLGDKPKDSLLDVARLKATIEKQNKSINSLVADKEMLWERLSVTNEAIGKMLAKAASSTV